MTDTILGIVVNWRRPANIPQILNALRGQTLPLKLALCECAPGTAWETSKEVQAGFDIVFTVSHNLGPNSRFIPALAMPQYTYTYFQVDDFLPGPRCVEDMYGAACELQGNFATIGQLGYRVGVKRYKQGESLVSVDVITSSELACTKDIVHAVSLHGLLAEKYPESIPCFEDDLLLCMGIQMHKKCPSYLTRLSDPSASERLKALPAPHALWMRADHYEYREVLCEKLRALGWKSYATD